MLYTIDDLKGLAGEIGYKYVNDGGDDYLIREISEIYDLIIDVYEVEGSSKMEIHIQIWDKTISLDADESDIDCYADLVETRIGIFDVEELKEILADIEETFKNKPSTKQGEGFKAKKLRYE